MIYLERVDEKIIIAEKTIIARSFCERAFGLIFRKFGENLDSMVFDRCNLIHSFFMSYKFDLIFVNREQRVIACYESAEKNRIFFGGKALDLVAIELPEGVIRKFDIKNGDFLTIER
jgi:uncharacterized membrane protein (UPF0127 family)